MQGGHNNLWTSLPSEYGQQSHRSIQDNINHFGSIPPRTLSISYQQRHVANWWMYESKRSVVIANMTIHSSLGVCTVKRAAFVSNYDIPHDFAGTILRTVPKSNLLFRSQDSVVVVKGPEFTIYNCSFIVKVKFQKSLFTGCGTHVWNYRPELILYPIHQRS